MLKPDYLLNLNEKQQEAVLHLDGPLLIVAGAGSGKTKVLTSRIAHIIKKNKAFITGQKKLNAADCISSDLRTTFSIILGAISAEGFSTISRIYHGLRGYENLQIKLKKLGIKIKLKK